MIGQSSKLLRFLFSALLLSLALGFTPQPTKAAGEMKFTFDPAQTVTVQLSKLHANEQGQVTTRLGSVFFPDPVQDVRLIASSISGGAVLPERYPVDDFLVKYIGPGNMGVAVMLSLDSSLPSGTTRQGEAEIQYLLNGVWQNAGTLSFHVELIDQPLGCPQSAREASLAMKGSEENWKKIDEVVDAQRVLRYDGPEVTMTSPNWAGAMGHIYVMDSDNHVLDSIHFDQPRPFRGQHVQITCMYDMDAWR